MAAVLTQAHDAAEGQAARETPQRGSSSDCCAVRVIVLKNNRSQRGMMSCGFRFQLPQRHNKGQPTTIDHRSATNLLPQYTKQRPGMTNRTTKTIYLLTHLLLLASGSLSSPHRTSKPQLAFHSSPPPSCFFTRFTPTPSQVESSVCTAVERGLRAFAAA